MARRARPFAFLRVGSRWINMSMVTDIEDHGDRLVVYVAADMARLAGREAPEPIDVARRFTIDDSEDIERLERRLLRNAED